MAAWINHNCADSRATHWKKGVRDLSTTCREFLVDKKQKSPYFSHTQIHKGVFMNMFLVKSVLCIVSNTEEGMLVFTDTNKCCSPHRHRRCSLPALNKQGESSNPHWLHWAHRPGGRHQLTGFISNRCTEQAHILSKLQLCSSVMQPCSYQLVICIKYSFPSIYKHPQAPHRSLCIDGAQKTTFTQQLTSCLIHPKWTSLDTRDVLEMTTRWRFNCPYSPL